MENKEFAYKKNRAEGAAEETDVTVNGRILRAAKKGWPCPAQEWGAVENAGSVRKAG